MWKLVIEDDEGKRTIVPLSREAYAIGRKEGNHIRLTERNVSREHARLVRANGPASRFALEDLQSYNGVYVNGLRVADLQDLAHGDLIQIGDYRIILHDDTVGEVTAGEDLKSTLPTSQFNRASLLLERPNRLVMLAGPSPGMEYPLDKDRLTVGRAEDAVVSINHTSVSRNHCEILSLGEGRFEIVDKGSSNGVRVNGVDLKRRIIEAGDVIELGDVRLKFVGHGQIFVPGVEDRAQSSVQPGAKGGGFVLWVIIGAFLAGGLVLGWKWREDHKKRPITLQEIDQRRLHDAEVLCPNAQAPIENCDRALSELDRITPSSPVLVTEGGGSLRDVFQGRLFDAIDGKSRDDSQSRETRIALLERALRLLPANDGRAAHLREQLDELKTPAIPGTSLPSAAITPPPSAKPTVSVLHTAQTATTQTTAPSVTTTQATQTTSTTRSPAPVKSATHAPKKSLFELATSSDPADESTYKTIMASKMSGGTASPLEVEAFRDWCKTRALSCYDTARKYLEARSSK